MNETNTPKPLTEERQYADQTPVMQRKPDESPGLNIEARFKIFDVESGDVLVEGRA
jgi:hypothetical protein